MTTAVLLAFAVLGSPQSAPRPDPTLKANYHIDRSDQEVFTERLRTKIQRQSGTWGTGPVEISFMGPLGLTFARNPSVRNFTEQQISRLDIFIDGKKIPYVEKPQKGDVGFWTLDEEPMTGHDQVAIRIASPGGNSAPVLEMVLEGTFVYSALRPGAKPDAFRFPLDGKMRDASVELKEEGYKADTTRLPRQLIQLGLVTDGAFRVSDVLERMGASTLSKPLTTSVSQTRPTT